MTVLISLNEGVSRFLRVRISPTARVYKRPSSATLIGLPSSNLLIQSISKEGEHLNLLSIKREGFELSARAPSDLVRF